MNKEKVALYTLNGKLSLDEYKQFMKKSKKLFLRYMMLYSLFGTIIISYITLFFDLKKLFLLELFFFYCFICVMVKLIENRKIENYYRKIEQIYGGAFSVEFYDDYMIRKSENFIVKIYYSAVVNILEIDNQVFLEYSNNYPPIVINKILGNEQLCLLLRKIQENNLAMLREKKKQIQSAKKYYKCSTSRILLIILSTLTILSFIFVYIFAKYLQNTFLRDKAIWLCYMFEIFPIITLIQGLKYERQNPLVSKVNIILGSFFLILLPLVCLGIFSNLPDLKDYQEDIKRYKDILSVQLPESGSVKQLNSYFFGEGDMTDTTMVEVSFDGNNIEQFEKAIQKNNNWLSLNQVPSDLKIFTSYQMNDNCSHCYYLIYNEINHQYNTIPADVGQYHIYVASYNIAKKKLEINDFDYHYQN